MDELDPNEIAAKIAIGSAEKSAGAFWAALDSTRRKVAAKFGEGFDAYKHQSIERYGKVRTLLQRDHPISLDDLYVKIRFEQDGEYVSDEEIFIRLSFDLRKIGTKILDHLDLSKWALAERDGVRELRATIENRVTERESSIKAMFG